MLFNINILYVQLNIARDLRENIKDTKKEYKAEPGDCSLRSHVGCESLPAENRNTSILVQRQNHTHTKY